MAGSVLRLTCNCGYIYNIPLVTLNCLKITECLKQNLRCSDNRKQVAIFLQYTSPLKYPWDSVLSGFDLGLRDGQNAFWEGTLLVDSEYADATTFIPTSPLIISAGKGIQRIPCSSQELFLAMPLLSIFEHSSVKVEEKRGGGGRRQGWSSWELCRSWNLLHRVYKNRVIIIK